MEDIGIVLPDFLYLPLLLNFGALSVQQASQWLENFAELTRCPVWFHRGTLDPLSHWRLFLPVAHYLSCIVVLDHFGGVAQEGASGRYCLYPCMLILGHALPPREGDLLAKVLLYGNLCNRLLVMNHALIVPCEQFVSKKIVTQVVSFFWGFKKSGRVYFFRQEVFTVLFLIRNVLIVLAPLIPSSSASLFLMAMLQLCGARARVEPLKIPLSNRGWGYPFANQDKRMR